MKKSNEAQIQVRRCIVGIQGEDRPEVFGRVIHIVRFERCLPALKETANGGCSRRGGLTGGGREQPAEETKKEKKRSPPAGSGAPSGARRTHGANGSGRNLVKRLHSQFYVFSTLPNQQN